MTDETIVAIFDTDAQADAAVRDLKAANVPADAISRHARKAPGTAAAAPAQETGFWASLFGGDPDHDDAVYDRSLDSGSTVVTVRTPAQHATMVSEILERHGPADIDERASAYGLSGTTTSTATSPVTAAPVTPTREGAAGMAAVNEGGTEGSSIKLSEEQLQVGKRAVNRGTTRVRRFVVETPVEEQVGLRDETVTVERRAVTGDHPVGDVDFTEKTVEMTEMDEEAVVGKTARVTEEVVLRKDATERVETVRDTVRREDVEIEKIPAVPPVAKT
ncbi:YsnF/AvaK domain-containing protein [Azospirillum sp. YIM DDC1]|uniref:YsnF/AvaK domain-containing protein n=1 Tax=Azospirillum aestuarii TaxID=2802052 RepID=A0ABS1I8E9_9PROT|nr:YsnF/AvaK domain-containing protein [Azospirillum aestuarii]MBK4723325.1 YsnF/AvaK domain-containing protein [Azospirillum aestuarii]